MLVNGYNASNNSRKNADFSPAGDRESIRRQVLDRVLGVYSALLQNGLKPC